jgi:hypothetical protein
VSQKPPFLRHGVERSEWGRGRSITTAAIGSFYPLAISANVVAHALNLPRVVCEDGVALNNNPLNLDLRARAELLTYLVASHFVARQATGEWLESDHVVESTTMWLTANGGGADVIERVMLASRAREIAEQIELISPLMFGPGRVTSMFCENLRLDFRSPIAQEVYQHCLTQLLNTRWY